MTDSRYKLQKAHVFLDAKGATGVGTQMNVQDYRHIVVWIATDGGADADLTCKCQGSIADDAPAWASAQSVTNEWDFIYMNDLENPATDNIPGDTGFVVATADDYRLLMVNVDALKWLNFRVTARTLGEVTVKGAVYSNL